MERPFARFLPDERRLHLRHGPIDLVIDAEGPGRIAALGAAEARFATILEELVAELPRLRRQSGGAPPKGAVARRMFAAALPHAARVFVTPMAAVAGAVADEILAAMRAAGPLLKAHVNNGGDIAIHLADGESAAAAICGLDGGEIGRIRIGASDGVGGVASSGRGGRSLSLGIAENVTALASSAAAADAAATLIANAVDLPGHPAIARTPARALDPDSDLGERLATTGCGRLAPGEVAAALDAGLVEARRMQAAGLIKGAALTLQGVTIAATDGAGRIEMNRMKGIAEHA
ncbi:UPF0280 family protein [Pikeienuella piscinae]|uniref:UPF0280 family protein n=1 Tax=Pikeienuella piscinae TaxID=2748098 RepID=A0A7L5BW44_9RHOB|nr:UPF0280 family protein [Pikeienuella piscinae]QIE56095.1 UPF0280 family protein [Pikeienuella piscinae]